jgi:uncharacterized protein (TIGR02118 family)
VSIRKSELVIAVGLVRRNPNLTPEQFKDYWLNVHVPMVKDKLPGLALYTGSFPLERGSTNSPSASYDAIVELGFESVEAMHQALNSLSFMSEERQISSAKFLVNADTLIVERYIVEL